MNRIRLHAVAAGLVLAAAVLAGPAQGQDPPDAFAAPPLNPGLPAPERAPNLGTPQAALEHLVLSVRAGEELAAARALDLGGLPAERQAERGPELARRLVYLLERKRLLDWEAVPDRPDGQAEPLPGRPAPAPRRSLLLGTLPLDDRDAEIRLSRLRPAGGEAVWVVARDTVENVPALYRAYGPTALDRRVPAWAERRALGVPLWEWAALLVALVLAGLAGWLGQRLVRAVLARAPSPWSRGLGEHVSSSVALVVAMAALATATGTVLPLRGPLLAVFQPLLLVGLVASVTWLAMQVLAFFTGWLQERHVDRLRQHDETRAMQRLTYLAVVRQVLVLMLFFVGLGVGLSQFTDLRLLGATLLTSAGVVSVVVGIAAQPILGNVIAGLQLALTQPVRIGDSVLFEGDWGYVEEVRYTYLVIRTWDQRRIVVPLRYFVTHPIENWSLTDGHTVKPIRLRLDHRVDVAALRETFRELLEADDAWDRRQDPSVLVTDADDDSIVVRALCSAEDPVAAFFLSCRLREQLLAHLRELEGGRYLPRRRVELEPAPGEPEAGPGAATASRRADPRPADD